MSGPHPPTSELGARRSAPIAKNKLAIVGTAIVVLLTTVAVFADDWFIALR